MINSSSSHLTTYPRLTKVMSRNLSSIRQRNVFIFRTLIFRLNGVLVGHKFYANRKKMNSWNHLYKSTKKHKYKRIAISAKNVPHICKSGSDMFASLFVCSFIHLCARVRGRVIECACAVHISMCVCIAIDFCEFDQCALHCMYSVHRWFIPF